MQPRCVDMIGPGTENTRGSWGRCACTTNSEVGSCCEREVDEEGRIVQPGFLKYPPSGASASVRSRHFECDIR